MLTDYSRRIEVTIVTGITFYTLGYAGQKERITLKRVNAENTTNNGGLFRFGYLIDGIQFWLTSFVLTTADVLYGDDLSIIIPANAQLICDVSSATANDSIIIYLYGGIDDTIHG